MKSYKNYTLKEYLDVLAAREPVPGGGSAAALVAASGAALISMVANYSVGKTQSAVLEKKIKDTLKQSERLRKRFLEVVDLDAAAYLKVVKTRKGSEAARKAAKIQAQKVPFEVCKLCYEAVELTPFLVKHGNKYLLSDVVVALEFLWAAFESAKVNVEVNQ